MTSAFHHDATSDSFFCLCELPTLDGFGSGGDLICNSRALVNIGYLKSISIQRDHQLHIYSLDIFTGAVSAQPIAARMTMEIFMAEY
ncbi:unnamed protein product [Periconia digitata]|uniref:Uncharacterized protein n=1 Tax=Periconia digitata TaxID=1303443 RepID=A0A9W4U4C1_9PLEO|nr:unnamed protein product [Periconia digitata]